MAWDNRDGWDYTSHFHACWRISSLRKLYEGTLPCFLSNDLEPIPDFSPAEVAVKRGRHRVVRLRSGQRSSRLRELAEDEFEDEEGNLFCRYPIHDNLELAAPLPYFGIARDRQEGGNGPTVQGRTRRRRGPNSGRTKCGQCGRVGHNKRTCPEQQAQPPSSVGDGGIGGSRRPVEVKTDDTANIVDPTREENDKVEGDNEAGGENEGEGGFEG